MQRDLWKRFNQMLVVPIVGVGVLYVALEPSTPEVDTEVASAVQDASQRDVDVSANRSIDPTLVAQSDASVVAPSVAPSASTTASAAGTPRATATDPATDAATTDADPTTTADPTRSTTSTTSTTSSTSTTAPPASSSPSTTTSTTSTTVPAPPNSVTTSSLPTVEPDCLVQLPLPLGGGWLCVVPGAGALLG